MALHYDIQIAAFAMFVVGMAYLTYKDYLSFLDLGPGGTPYNFYGYLTITLLRLVALRNPREAAPVPDQLRNTGYLSKTRALPKRKVPRPEVVGIAPHRQMNQKASASMFIKLSDEIRGLAEKYPKRLRMGKSCFEKHCPALFSNRELNKTCNGEICHAHTVDGSMHLTLHPEDAEKVIQAGFGERHPLARGGWCRRFVPQGFIMIYAPRDDDELEIVMSIIRAAIGWVSGERLLGPDDDEVDFADIPKDINGTIGFDPKNDQVSQPDANMDDRGLIAEAGKQVMEVA
ncbi:hypothetical protein BJ508DRAFT_326751 [Ascobolus immersus RN42]|uniref:Luciferase domain-containing protein n=1 Tax=Ascobolus immersus RN42 TaxID=1160509 RepID=A0A3N4I4X4_ASCIM|nr:hypothetical protein BJ508DRAFT_326751 [Ascobolus immersus RN42]